jgi:hypothetical protein
MEPFEFKSQKAGSGMCAHMSLINSLLLLDISITVKDAIKYTGVPRWKAALSGTDEQRLIKAIKRAGCKPHVKTCHSSKEAKKEIDSFLRQGMPIIMSVEDEQHWAVLAGKKGKNGYYWIDSADKGLVGCWSWESIEEWMCYDDNEYYFIGIEAKDMSQSFVKKFGLIYPRLKRNQRLSLFKGLFGHKNR